MALSRRTADWARWRATVKTDFEDEADEVEVGAAAAAGAGEGADSRKLAWSGG